MELLEHPVAPLRVGVELPVVGQRADHLDAVFGEELREVGVGREVEDGQVAAVDDVAPERRALRDQPPEVRVQLPARPP